ncbi:MAG: hypothetical protein K2Z25_06755 [Beijerinckiaceae bacterium]|nr:hypothetical protein [Beijerinckiaceae bacterium]
MQALRRHHVLGDQLIQRLQSHRGRADVVGQRLDGEVDAFAPLALALAVGQLVLTERLEEDGGGSGPSHFN